MKKTLLSILGLAVTIVGVYLGWLQYQRATEAERVAQPDVVVCLRALSYSRRSTSGMGEEAISVPHGRVSMHLVNKGGTDVTVTRVMVNPVGTWRDGRHGGMGDFAVETNKNVPAKGVTVIADLAFIAPIAVKEKFWIEKPEAVNVRASWPGGVGPMLACVPTSFGWSCGRQAGGSTRSILVEQACQ